MRYGYIDHDEDHKMCSDLGMAWDYMGLKFRCEEEKHSTLSKKYTNIEIETRTCSGVATLGSSRHVPMHTFDIVLINQCSTFLLEDACKYATWLNL